MIIFPITSRAPASFSRIVRGGQTSFSRILRSDDDPGQGADKRSSFSRILRADPAAENHKRDSFSRILRSGAQVLRDIVRGVEATIVEHSNSRRCHHHSLLDEQDVEMAGVTADDYYDQEYADPQFFYVHSRAPGYSRIL